jgi:hypothetical protein
MRHDGEAADGQPPPDAEQELAEIGRACRQAFYAALPPRLQEAQRELNRTRRARAREGRRIHEAKRAARVKRMMELMLSGHCQAEMETALGVHKSTVSRDLQLVWPFPQATRDQRYCAVKLGALRLAALDRLAHDLGLPRLRALEEAVEAVLDEDARAARRSLRITQKETKL